MWSDYFLFVLKAVTLLVVLIVAVAAIARASRAGVEAGEGRLVVKNLNERLREQGDAIRHAVCDKKSLKAFQKVRKSERKAEKSGEKRRTWVLSFKGDIQASQVDSLRQEVSAILQVARREEEVVVVLESPGGAVSGYGLAASQLARLRDEGLKLTVCVDKVAASGGYMMACVAHRIIAAPFAIVGSIGVLAQIPNIHQLLKRHDIDVEVLTAGRHKAPLTLMGEKTDEGRDKFLSDLQGIHDRFKGLVGRYRPNLELERVTEGDFWLAEDALELALIDEIGTSDAYLASLVSEREVVGVKWKPKKKLKVHIKTAASALMDGGLDRLSRRVLP